MTNLRSVHRLAACLLVASALVACGDDDGAGGSGGTAGNGGSGGTAGTGGNPETLCAKYGGAANVASVVADHVVPAIAGDCRINTFFTSLPQASLTHVVECLSIQVQGLFECPGVTYAGSEDSRGVACRSMVDAHTNLGISDGDFNALLDDVVAGLTAAGVDEADINAAAPALVGMRDDIVEGDGNDVPTAPMCEMDGGL